MALTDYRVKGVDADMTEEAFVAAKRSLGSPVSDDAARAVYGYCVARRFSPAALLAWFVHESGGGRNGWAATTKSWGNTRPPSFGAAHIGVYHQDNGTFYPASLPADQRPLGRYLSAYANWADGGISTVARFFDHAPYHGKDTVRQIVPVWAPSNDGNDVENYIAKVLADIERWATPQGGQTSMGHVPKPPINARPVVPPKSSEIGYDLSATPRTPIGTCTHSMVGTLWGTDSHFRLPGTAGLTDFGIGQKDLGQGYAEIIQWCDPFGKVIPWANGEATGIEGAGRRFVDTHGVGQINRGLVSIETEDGATPHDAQGRPTAPATAAQWSSLVWLTAFIHAEWCGQTAATLDWHLIHKEFATKDCPFPRIYNHLDELRTAVRAVMRHWQEGAAYPAGGVMVNGLRLTVPQGAAPAPAVESPFIRALRHLWAA